MPIERGATLKDVSNLVGVNVGAVSMVLNGNRSSTRVSEATRKRILAAAEELRYRPNAIARSLRNQRTDIIGFYSSFETVNTRNHFFADLVGGVQDGCNAHRKDLLFLSTLHFDSVEETYAKLVNRQVDGLVMFPEYEDKLMDRLATSHLPVVSIVNASLNLPCVAIDDAMGAWLQVEHLAGKGHKRVLYRTVRASDNLEKITSVSRRLTAFEEAAREFGISVAVVRENATNSRNPDWDAMLTEVEKSVLFGPKSERATAVACWTDGSAHAMAAYCHRQGIQVPGDLAIIGFDGYPYWGYIESARFPLTTIMAPWRAVAETAVTLVQDKLNGKEIPNETLLPVALMAGGTT